MTLRVLPGSARRWTLSALIEFVNLYLDVMLPPIGLHGGVTDKYIGDAIMAFWGPPFTRRGDPAVEACHAALEQRAALAELRRRARDELGVIDAERLDMRCGIATGDVVAGSIGPPQSRNYTVIGDRVNLASRLEGANKALGSRILVCEETRRRACRDFVFRELDTIQVRGRVRRERVFELVARADQRVGCAGEELPVDAATSVRRLR